LQTTTNEKNDSATIVYEDENGYISFGARVVIARNRKLNLYITGGQSLMQFVESEKDKSKWMNLILNYTFSYLNETAQLLPTIIRIIENTKQKSFDEVLEITPMTILVNRADENIDAFKGSQLALVETVV